MMLAQILVFFIAMISSFIQVSEQQLPIAPNNVALRKTTYQSSLYTESTGNNGDSNKAVDGNPDSDYIFGKSCSHTWMEANAWWAVDLGSSVRVGHVFIYNRGDFNYGPRLHDFVVGVTDSNPGGTPPPDPSNYITCATYTGAAGNGDVIDMTCTGNATGRYVVIQMPGTTQNYLTLCEVVVTVITVTVVGSCSIELQSYGQLDTPSSQQVGFIKVDGTVYVNSSMQAGVAVHRGVNIMVLDPATCIPFYNQSFDTYASAQAATNLATFITTVDPGTIIIGATFGAPMSALYNALQTLRIAGMPVQMLGEFSKFAFILQTQYPWKTVYQTAVAGSSNLYVNAFLTGTLNNIGILYHNTTIA